MYLKIDALNIINIFFYYFVHVIYFTIDFWKFNDSIKNIIEMHLFF